MNAQFYTEPTIGVPDSDKANSELDREIGYGDNIFHLLLFNAIHVCHCLDS